MENRELKLLPFIVIDKITFCLYKKENTQFSDLNIEGEFGT